MLKELQEKLTRLLDEAEGTYGVAIHHFESGEEFAYQADEVFYAASIIKVPIMMAVYDQAWKGTLSLSEELVIRAEDMVGGSGILFNLTPGLRMSIYDVMMLMIIESDNTATNVLIDRLGKEAIQGAMAEWGLTKTQFHNKLMIVPAKIENYNLITAGEMTHLMKLLGDGKIVSWHACNEMVKIMKQQKFNDGIPSNLPVLDGTVGALPSYEFAHKTGWVTGTEHDVGILYFPGHTFAVSVLAKEIRDRHATHRVMGEIGQLLYQSTGLKM